MAPSPASEKEQYGPVGINHLDDVNGGIINHPDSRLIDPKEVDDSKEAGIQLS
jgi:hypothetical protein